MMRHFVFFVTTVLSVGVICLLYEECSRIP